ncbi:DUF3900 domain-containing protein [Brevibacillus sp. SYP-B805]|uniref:DUF3900 domain-containing protein n=1 Tax=Brevibacillus sp. SYP-B805 TaxID=1578199 RepID=UPI0013ECB82A|nr:DUF3900 domain-containing protein [Brevibacillus sp. SYP-B805]NGQ96332.1 DUF3900 domain-containing protein [Brevibacillus sp. SYP-B805]
MHFSIEWLVFTVIEQEAEESGSKRIRMTKALSHDEYQRSELRPFLDGEFVKIAKRKVEANPKSEGSPTKLGQFVVAEGHGVESNPNYALLNKLLAAESKEQGKEVSLELVQAYLRTSQVRSGVLLVVKTKLERFDDRFLFILKCDFEQKTAVITDETTLIANVERAINAKNMKSILYPHMIEPGMLDWYHVKIHQFSHARYFEEFLKYIEYPQTVTDIVSREVVSLAKQHLEQVYPEPTEERLREEEAIESLAATPKRELSERWEHETVMEAMQLITERQPDVEMRFRLDHLQIRALLSDYGSRVHIAKANGRYLVLLEGDSLQFEKGVSPVEFLKPKPLQELLAEMGERGMNPRMQQQDGDDLPPW